MKKQILLFVMMLLPMMASAQSSVKIGDIYYKLNSADKTAEVVYSRFRYTGDVIIPSSVTYNNVDYSVTSIANQAFARSTDLTSVSIPATVKSIGSNIFSECTSLASIVIEKGNAVYDTRENCNAIIETASNKLLYGCMNSAIPDGVTSIENSAFSGCTGLTSINIPNSVTSIGNSAFSGCTGLTSINIPNSVTDLGNNAFESCSSLAKVELNNNAIVSERYKYENMISIKDIFGTQVKEYVLGENVTSIGDGAFCYCTNLTSVYMTDNVTSIGKQAFFYCNELTSINMSDNLTSIGELAFYNCYHLASITIPSGVTSIDQWTFEGCAEIKKVEIYSSAILSKEYHQSYSLANFFGSQVEEYVLGEDVTSLGKYVFSGCTKMTSINIPINLTNIGEGAFYCCYGLSSINIPKTVTYIGKDAFFGCIGLLSIQVESGNRVYDSRDNCNAIILTAGNSLMQGCQNTMIPNSVTTIGDYAFYSCPLTSISIPNSVMSIGSYAFCGCTELTSISIPNSVTIIGLYAFASCKGLTSVSLSDNVGYIGDYAFFSCTGLTSITIPNSVTSIGSRVFNNCSGLTEIQVESGNTRYDSRNDCNAIIETASNKLLLGCKNTIIPNSVTSIGECAFGGCVGLTEIIIPKGVTSIGASAFSNCTNLTQIVIPNGVTSIGDVAFNQCYNLAIVVIPNSVTTIGEGAFLSAGFKEVYCYAEQVPKTGNNTFNYSCYQASLHVPAGSIDTYRNAEQWKNFKEIVALPAMDDYCMMVKDGKVWKTGIYGSGNPVRHVEYFYFDGDTIIDGKTCKQMMCQQYYNDDDSQHSSLSYVGAWYEEDRKVYTYDTTSKQFVLMYDFSVDANDTLVINQEYYRIGLRQTGGLKGFKGVYRDVRFLSEEGPIYSPSWLEGVGSIDGPTVNVYSGYVDPLRFLMSCTVDDEVIYFNDDYEDGATPVEMNANKRRFDFTHTVKTRPKAPSTGREERPKGVASADTQSLYGEYNQQQLSIHLDSLVETYVVCITNESNEVVYEKTINTVGIVGLNIDISTYAKGCYTATVENSNESFVGEFEMQATGNDITLSCPDDNHPHAIDLGLPSGTKWACCNVGADTPKGYGDYYAWGEIEEKEIYDWNTYIHCDGTEESCHDIGSDIAGTQYDVAHMKWGGSWVMPSSDQIIELVNNCTYTWTSINGVWCGHFTGPSGSTIILPGAGYRFLGDLYHDSSRGYYSCSGYYWSSTQHPVGLEYTYGVYLDLGYADLKGFSPEYGRSVRPVLSATNNITNPITCSNVSDQAIYNIYGIKVADDMENAGTLPSGIYIFNGKKIVIK